MNDEQILTLLRTAADRAPQCHVDIPQARLTGNRMRRRRHAGAVLGSGVTVAGFAAILTLAGSSGQSVVQGAGPSAQGQGAPAIPSYASPDGGNACSPILREQFSNIGHLREILGSADWQLVPMGTGSCPKGAVLQPTSGSAVQAALPTGDEVTASLTLTTQSSAPNACAPPAGTGSPSTCTTVRSSGGQTVVIERSPLAALAVPAKPSGSNAAGHGSITADYTRPDGTLVSVGLQVEDPGMTTPRVQQTDAWFDSYVARMADAASDPTISTSAAEQAVTAGAADAAIFRDHLGADGWERGRNGDTVFDWLQPVPGSTVADGLPSGYGAEGHLATLTPDDPSYGAECKVMVDSGTTFSPCTTQQTPDGLTVRIQQQHTPFPLTDKEAWDAIRVVFARPDGTHVMVQLQVWDYKGQASPARQKEAVAWLNTYLDKLIATATDPAITTVPANQ